METLGKIKWNITEFSVFWHMLWISKSRNTEWGPPTYKISWNTVLETEQIVYLFVICKMVPLDQMISDVLWKSKNLWVYESGWRTILSIFEIKNMSCALSRRSQGLKGSRTLLEAVFLRNRTSHAMLRTSPISREYLWQNQLVEAILHLRV